MENIGIVTKRSDHRALEATRHLVQWLHTHGRRITLSDEVAKDLAIPSSVARASPFDSLPANQDLVVVIGGDGTFIATARAVSGQPVPLLGINMGRLGFLTEIHREDMIPALQKVLEGHYRIEERMMLSASVIRHGRTALEHRVLNDVVTHKGALARMIEFEVSIDDQFVFASRADGLIVSTPTGSTAYALSAGGPIMHPSLDAILLAPVCPHTLSNRPIAVPGSGVISITLGMDNLNRLLTLDGQTGFPLMNGDQILIRKSDHPLQVLHPPNRNYYDILRGKLRWEERPEG
jgi:NAD+ kinase